jgi:hypothetical protein
MKESNFDAASAEDIQLPPGLRAALARMDDREIRVPAEMDAAILSRARQSFARRRRNWHRVQRMVAGLAAAAVLTIAARIFIPMWHLPATPAVRPQLAQVADVNHDGRVNILDAYVVARKIARHEPLDPAWDINGDGVVGQKDVDLIANLAVRAPAEAPQ